MNYNKNSQLLSNSNITDRTLFLQNSFMFAIFIIDIFQTLCCILIKERHFLLDFAQNDYEISYYLYLNMFLSLISAILCIFKYHYQLEYQKKTGQIYPSTGYFQREQFTHFILEFILLVIHPSPFLKNATYTSYNYDLRITVEYYYNDIAIIISLLRNVLNVFYIFKATKYNSARIQRINFMFNDQKISSFLPIKIFLANNFLSFIFYSFFWSILIFSAIIIITERPLSYNYDRSLDEWNEMIWYVVVSMTTIGYGDRTSKTLLSRFFIMVLVIWGNLWISILINAIVPFLTQTLQEEKAYNLIERISLQQKLTKINKEIISTAIQVNYFKKKNYPQKTIDKNLFKIQNLTKDKRIKRFQYKKLVKLTNYFADDFLSKIEKLDQQIQDSLFKSEIMIIELQYILQLLVKKKSLIPLYEKMGYIFENKSQVTDNKNSIVLKQNQEFSSSELDSIKLYKRLKKEKKLKKSIEDKETLHKLIQDFLQKNN